MGAGCIQLMIIITFVLFIGASCLQMFFAPNAFCYKLQEFYINDSEMGFSGFLLIVIILKGLAGTAIWCCFMLSVLVSLDVGYSPVQFSQIPIVWSPLIIITFTVVIILLIMRFGDNDSFFENMSLIALNIFGIFAIIQCSFSTAMLDLTTKAKKFQNNAKKKQRYASFMEGVILSVLLTIVFVIFCFNDSYLSTYSLIISGCITLFNIFQLWPIHGLILIDCSFNSKFKKHLAKKDKSKYINTFLFLSMINCLNFVYIIIFACYYFKDLLHECSKYKSHKSLEFGMWFFYPCFSLWALDQFGQIIVYIHQYQTKNDSSSPTNSSPNNCLITDIKNEWHIVNDNNNNHHNNHYDDIEEEDDINESEEDQKREHLDSDDDNYHEKKNRNDMIAHQVSFSEGNKNQTRYIG